MWYEFFSVGVSLFLDCLDKCCSHHHWHEGGFPTLKGDVEVAMFSGGSLQCIVSTGGGILCGSCSQWVQHWSDSISPISGGSISVVNLNQFPSVVLFLGNGIFVQCCDGCAVDLTPVGSKFTVTCLESVPSLSMRIHPMPNSMK